MWNQFSYFCISFLLSAKSVNRFSTLGLWVKIRDVPWYSHFLFCFFSFLPHYHIYVSKEEVGKKIITNFNFANITLIAALVDCSHENVKLNMKYAIEETGQHEPRYHYQPYSCICVCVWIKTVNVYSIWKALFTFLFFNPSLVSLFISGKLVTLAFHRLYEVQTCFKISTFIKKYLKRIQKLDMNLSKRNRTST